MWPTVYQFGGLALSVYDVMRIAAIVAATTMAGVLNQRQGIPVRMTLGIALCCAPLAILGAWLFDALESAPAVDAIGAELVRGGSSVYGALFTMVIVVWLATRWLEISALRFFDGAAPALAAGEAVSRLGCFAAGCCYGKPWSGPWAVVFPAGSFAIHDQWQRGVIDVLATHAVPVHPVQLYGVVLMTSVAVMLARRLGRPHPEGEIFFLFLIAYGAYRVAIAPLRMEVLASTITFSAIFMVSGLIGLSWCRARLRRRAAPIAVPAQR